MDERPHRRLSSRAISAASLVLLVVVVVGLLAAGNVPGPEPEPTRVERQGGKVDLSPEPPPKPRSKERPSKVVVPDVTDDDYSTAKTKITDRGLRAVTARYGNAYGVNSPDRCIGMEPGSRVASQSPAAGTRERPGRPVDLRPTAYAQIGCSHSRAPRECFSEELKLHLETDFTGLAGGSETSERIVSIGITHVGRGSACQLNETLTLRIEDPASARDDEVMGNPAILHLHHALKPSDSVQVDWSWTSWCGTRTQVATIAKLGAITKTRLPDPERTNTGTRSALVPRCRGESQLYLWLFGH